MVYTHKITSYGEMPGKRPVIQCYKVVAADCTNARTVLTKEMNMFERIAFFGKHCTIVVVPLR